MRKPPLTSDELSEIKDYWAEGMSIRDIAAGYHRKRRTIKRLIAKMTGLGY